MTFLSLRLLQAVVLVCLVAYVLVAMSVAVDILAVPGVELHVAKALAALGFVILGAIFVMISSACSKVNYQRNLRKFVKSRDHIFQQVILC